MKKFVKFYPNLEVTLCLEELGTLWCVFLIANAPLFILNTKYILAFCDQIITFL